jgi:hypothetical protein
MGILSFFFTKLLLADRVARLPLFYELSAVVPIDLLLSRITGWIKLVSPGLLLTHESYSWSYLSFKATSSLNSALQLSATIKSIFFAWLKIFLSDRSLKFSYKSTIWKRN